LGCFENRAADEVLGPVIAVRDIARRREIEAQLLQSQRMDAAANMAGGLAHDFNNQPMVRSVPPILPAGLAKARFRPEGSSALNLAHSFHPIPCHRCDPVVAVVAQFRELVDMVAACNTSRRS
jgi:hypothetical protein